MSHLQRPQKRNQVVLLAFRQTQVEAAIVEVHSIQQSSCRTVVEVWGSCGQCAQDRSLGLADIGTLAGNHGPPRVGGAKLLAGCLANQGVDRQTASVKRPKSRKIRDADVDRE